MKDEKRKHVPLSIEVKIRYSKGRSVWKWRESRGNLLFGLEKTNEYAETLLGIDNRQIDNKQPNKQPPRSEPEPELDTDITKTEPRNIFEHAFGRMEPIEPIFGRNKRGGERR